jgi:hypothetical protein
MIYKKVPKMIRCTTLDLNEEEMKKIDRIFVPFEDFDSRSEAK